MFRFINVRSYPVFSIQRVITEHLRIIIIVELAAKHSIDTLQLGDDHHQPGQKIGRSIPAAVPDPSFHKFVVRS